MTALNMPVEMISVCTVDGGLKPLRFRFEDEGHQLHVVRVREVLVAREINYVGRQMYQYLCRARLEDKEVLFELRYTVKSHCWTLFRLVG